MVSKERSCRDRVPTYFFLQIFLGGNIPASFPVGGTSWYRIQRCASKSSAIGVRHRVRDTECGPADPAPGLGVAANGGALSLEVAIRRLVVLPAPAFRRLSAIFCIESQLVRLCLETKVAKTRINRLKLPDLRIETTMLFLVAVLLMDCFFAPTS